MYKSIIIYGAICGVLLTLYINMLDLSGVIYHTTWGAYLGYLAILILPICIFIALRDWRKTSSKILLRHALIISLFTSFLAATIYSAYTFIDIRFFNAQHLDNLFAYTQEEMKRAGHSAAEISDRMAQMRSHYFSIQPYMNTYIWYLAMGLVYGFMFHFVFRLKQPKQTT
jgi:hypothetical protein